MFRKLILAGVIILFAVTGANAQCPCKYRAKGLQYVSSAQPIPDAHVRCMTYVDKTIVLAKQMLRGCSARFEKEVCDAFRHVEGYTQTDWGVPPVKISEEMFALANREIEKYRDSREKSERELQDELRSKYPYPPLINAIRNSIAFDGWTIASNEFMRSYNQCVIENGLPPTTE